MHTPQNKSMDVLEQHDLQTAQTMRAIVEELADLVAIAQKIKSTSPDHGLCSELEQGVKAVRENIAKIAPLHASS